MILKPVSKSKSDEQILCACGCGKLRNRYDNKGREFKYISGHNDNWKDNHRPFFSCQICGKAFQKNCRKQKLCSIGCRKVRNQQARPYQEKQIEVNCFTCGEKFMRKKSSVHTRNFCSQICKNQWMSEAFSDKFTRPKRLAKQRDENKCRICGFDAAIEVHHIIARRFGGKDTLENLITLCPNHHTMADRQIIPVAELQQMIAALA